MIVTYTHNIYIQLQNPYLLDHMKIPSAPGTLSSWSPLWGLQAMPLPVLSASFPSPSDPSWPIPSDSLTGNRLRNSSTNGITKGSCGFRNNTYTKHVDSLKMDFFLVSSKIASNIQHNRIVYPCKKCATQYHSIRALKEQKVILLRNKLMWCKKSPLLLWWWPWYAVHEEVWKHIIHFESKFLHEWQSS